MNVAWGLHEVDFSTFKQARLPTLQDLEPTIVTFKARLAPVVTRADALMESNRSAPMQPCDCLRVNRRTL